MEPTAYVTLATDLYLKLDSEHSLMPGYALSAKVVDYTDNR